MGTKTINIMDDVYDSLIILKAPDESFSDEIRRLIKQKSSIMNFAGAWKDMPDKEYQKIKKSIMDLRKDRSRLDLIHKKMSRVED